MSLPARGDFPALERHHRGRPVAYFDGPGGTQVAAPVVEAISRYLIHHNANTHWDFPSSHETDAMLEQARETFGHFFGGDPAGVIFGANMTTLTFHLSRTLAAGWGPDDEVVVTELDHHANVDPWKQLGVKVVVVPLLTDSGQLDYDRMREAIGPRTRLVAVGAASNALGTVNQVAQVLEWARQVGALSFVDAVHYAPHFLPNVAAWGCDFLACSAYKFYGPHVGVLWGRPELLAQLRPPHLEPAGPGLETGTLNHEGIAGAAAAVEFLACGRGRAGLQATYACLEEHGQLLLERLWAGLERLPRVTLFGPHPEARRTPTVAFTVAGLASGQVAARLAEQAVFVSHGDFYATTVARRLGQAEHGLVRAGCACYTTSEEVDRLVAGVADL